MTAKTFSPVGACIYCGATSGLTREHIVPFALGGRLVLPDASCPQCSKATSGFELRLLRSPNWWPLRRALNLSSRRARAQPDSFAVEVTAAGITRVADIKVANYPLVVVVLDFDPPTHLTGAPIPQGGDEHAIAQRMYALPIGGFQFAWGVEARFPTGLVATKTEVTFRVDISAQDLARFLAKVALGWGVAQYGLAAFEQIYVRDLIVGPSREPNRWVGGCALKPKFDDRSLHLVTDTRVGRDVVVFIQLFRPPPGGEAPPVYQVVVGQLHAQ
jgi:hypothetical protein